MIDLLKTVAASLLILIAFDLLSYAECDCPPIEMDLISVCGPAFKTPSFATIVLTGGCAEAEGLPYQVDAPVYWGNGNTEQLSGEAFFLEGAYTMTVTDSNPDCEYTFEIPMGNYAPSNCRQVFNCETGTINQVPDDAFDPDTIGISGTLEQFSVSWADEYNCTRTVWAVAGCNVTDCPSASLFIYPQTERTTSIVNCTETATYYLSDTHSADLYYQACCPGDCPFQVHHSYEIDGESNVGQEPYDSYYYGWGSPGQVEVLLTYPSQADSVIITIIDNLTDCVHEVKVKSEWDCATICDCNNFELRVEDVCDEQNDIIEAMYIFSSDCFQYANDPSIELTYMGSTYLITDTFYVTHQVGDDFTFSDVQFKEEATTFCSRDYDLSAILGDCALSLQGLQAPMILAYVNNSDLQISVENKVEQMDYQLYNIQGVEMAAGNLLGQASISVDRWPSGIYILNLREGEQSWTRSVYVQ